MHSSPSILPQFSWHSSFVWRAVLVACLNVFPVKTSPSINLMFDMGHNLWPHNNNVAHNLWLVTLNENLPRCVQNESAFVRTSHLFWAKTVKNIILITKLWHPQYSKYSRKMSINIAHSFVCISIVTSIHERSLQLSHLHLHYQQYDASCARHRHLNCHHHHRR